MRGHLVVMARAPRYGVGKRRLAREAGELAAWRFQHTALAGLLRRLGGDPRWTAWLALTPDASLRETRPWPPGWTPVPQGGGDLGARMGRQLAGLPPGPAVIVGADIPGIRRRHVAAALAALGAADWVLGPAGDGGYWLIGARRRPRLALPFAGMGAGVRWGTAHALSDTRAGMTGRVALLETLEDVDTAADLVRWGGGVGLA